MAGGGRVESSAGPAPGGACFQQFYGARDGGSPPTGCATGASPDRGAVVLARLAAARGGGRVNGECGVCHFSRISEFGSGAPGAGAGPGKPVGGAASH